MDGGDGTSASPISARFPSREMPVPGLVSSKTYAKISGNASDDDKAYILAALPIFLPAGTFAAEIASRLKLVEVNAEVEGGFDGGAVGQTVWRVVYEINTNMGNGASIFVYHPTDLECRYGQLLWQLARGVFCFPGFDVGGDKSVFP